MAVPLSPSSTKKGKKEERKREIRKASFNYAFPCKGGASNTVP
jgi:hypothetical protein